ncbi:hypothetical protein [Sinobaca sp. H24]|uniref:hypothetical protein n=1 Tax=Sinobaca sp. H24 TaxID=2923376 RepID=UPI00207992E5|nr:hypothetical protein [Sinobaca sp. H24]
MEDVKMIEEEHLQTADRYLLTELLVNTMEQDRSFFLEKTMKLGHFYQELFDVLILRIKQDLRDIKLSLKQQDIRLARSDETYPGFIVYDIYCCGRHERLHLLKLNMKKRISELLRYYLLDDTSFFDTYYAFK